MSKNTTSTGDPIESGQFQVPPMHIPDGKGGALRTELVLFRSREKVIKINWWHGPDGMRVHPHSHPWPFESTILRGGYTEDRWTWVVGGDEAWDSWSKPVDEASAVRGDGGWWEKTTHTYATGDVNSVPAGVYHQVRAITPGTVTRMVCGALVNGGAWGHLMDGVEVPNKPDPEFLRQLRELNPHKRPAS